MNIPKTLPMVLAMGMPRVAVSYAGYTGAPILLVNWLSSRSYAKGLMLLVFLAASALINWAMGLTFSFTSWALELALFLPFMAAVLGFAPARFFNGRSFIRMLNALVFVTSMISLFRMGFPFLLPYIHYLPDLFNGGFGNGGAKIVTIIGFFGVAEGLSRKRRANIQDNWSLVLSLANFIVPNFILGIVAGAAALIVFVRRNRAVLFAGAALAMLVVPYLQFRAETKNDAFAEAYGSNPKIYAFALIGRLYASEPHTVLVGTGVGQFSSQPAIWTSPVNTILGTHELPKLPGMYSAEVHDQYLAPILLRFRNQRYAIESSANKPYSGITQLLAELGLPATILILYCAYLFFWRRPNNDLGRTAFLFLIAINLLDPQVDSPWFGVMLFATFEALLRDSRIRARQRLEEGPRESGVFYAPKQPVSPAPVGQA